ncbi:MAG: response regulator [Nitrospiraceae bacterium]
MIKQIGDRELAWAILPLRAPALWSTWGLERSYPAAILRRRGHGVLERRSVLIVEDEEQVRLLLAVMLERQGYEATTGCKRARSSRRVAESAI